MYLQGNAFRTCVWDTIGLILSNGRLDATSIVLLEKFNKLEGTIAEQSKILGRIQEATSFLELGFPSSGKSRSPFCPTQPRISSEVFQVPKGRWASLDHFMSLPFVATLFPANRKYQSIVFDNTDTRKDCKLPNLQRDHLRKLVGYFLAEIHPLHPIMEVATIERIKNELDEDGLSWTGETAVILHILAIGSVLAGLDSGEYNSAAKRRMGFAVENVNIIAIQAHYLQGYVLGELFLI